MERFQKKKKKTEYMKDSRMERKMKGEVKGEKERQNVYEQRIGNESQVGNKWKKNFNRVVKLYRKTKRNLSKLCKN